MQPYLQGQHIIRTWFLSSGAEALWVWGTVRASLADNSKNIKEYEGKMEREVGRSNMQTGDS